MSLNTYGQNDYMNLEKYWYYRNRLKYFVQIGDNQGESCIACIRNKNCSNILRYGQHMTHLGYYIGVLATEAKLLLDNNRYDEATLTLDELDHALNAYERLDMCESKPPWNSTSDILDGFFEREDLYKDFILSHPKLNDTLTPQYDINYIKANQLNGTPAYVDSVNSAVYKFYHPPTPTAETPDPWLDWDGELSPSQDEIISLLMGFAIVYKSLPNTNYSYRARLYAKKLLNYARNYNEEFGEKAWHLYRPDGIEIPPERGGSTRIYSYAFAKVYEFFDIGPWQSYMYWDWFNNYDVYWKALWNTFQFTGNLGWNNDCMVAQLAAVGNSFNQYGVNTTAQGLYNITVLKNWQTFYILLWRFLHDENTLINIDNKISDQISSAPICGPYAYDDVHADSGWASTARFWQPLSNQNNGDKYNYGNYNGTDFMLLYNLYRLVEKPTNYFSLKNRFLNEYFPVSIFSIPPIFCYGSNEYPAIVQAFEVIESNSIIKNNCDGDSTTYGDVTYRAGEEIILKPGFKVEEGAKFKAYIEPLNCKLSYDKSINNSIFSNYSMVIPTDITLNENKILTKYHSRYYNLIDYDYNDNKTTTIDDYSTKLNCIIYPNPSDGLISIDFINYQNDPFDISIHNMLGTCIFYRTNQTGNNQLINLSLYPAGCYYVIIKLNNVCFKQKITLK
ncbi:MAG: hypothetical protein Kow0068_01550 [Marinilabiliales bacterium]